MKLRTGFSTSACAAAAASGALIALETGQAISAVTINLHTMQDIPFQLCRCEFNDGAVLCGVIKDAGDDPDVTNGLEIQALVRRTELPGIKLLGGKGVGIVTLPGLPVEVGNPAINPGSRRLILRVIEQTLQRLQTNSQNGYEITIIVPEGEQIALQTMNPKLGIVGGISILGTDGLVHPYSAPAFRTSLYYELKVAQGKGCSRVAFGTGKRSVDYLQKMFSQVDKIDYISVGDELGFPIDQAAKMGFQEIYIGGMIGKLSKVALGRFQTHVNEGKVDFEFLAALAEKAGASLQACEAIRIARTSRAVQNLLKKEGISLEAELARMACREVYQRCKQDVSIKLCIFSLEGQLLGYAEELSHD